jgi:hypothetical protein
MSNPDPPGGKPTSAARAQTLPLQGLVNRVNRGLLRTPLLCRLVGRRLLTMYLVGRKSGRHYAVPGCLHPPQRDPAGRHAVCLGAQPAHRRTGAHPSRRQAAIRRCPCRGRRDRRRRAPGIDGP